MQESGCCSPHGRKQMQRGGRQPANETITSLVADIYLWGLLWKLNEITQAKQSTYNGSSKYGFFPSHCMPLSHLSKSALQKLWFIYCASCKCLPKCFNNDEAKSSILEILEVSNAVSGILGRPRGRIGLISISLSWCWGVVVYLACLALVVQVLPALLRGPINFACRTQRGCFHRKVLKSSNVVTRKLGSLVVPDFVLLRANGPAAMYSNMFATSTCHLVSANKKILLQILFPTGVVPDAMDSDAVDIYWGSIFFTVNYVLLLSPHY